MIRKLVALAGLVVACAGVGLFVALGVYVWSLRGEVDRQTAGLARKANEAGDEADKAIRLVREVITQAENDLAQARALAPPPKPKRPVSALEMALAQSASKRLAGSVDQAHGAVVTASDAVVVAQAALDVFAGSELKDVLGVRPSQVDATRNTIDKARTELRQARTVLGTEPTPEQLQVVSVALDQGQMFTNEMSRVVDTFRNRVEATRSMIDRWTWRIAVGTTAASALAALGQLFMARFCWRRLRDLPA
jgi:hydrogenase maturation protease